MEDKFDSPVKGLKRETENICKFIDIFYKEYCEGKNTLDRRLGMVQKRVDLLIFQLKLTLEEELKRK